MNESSATITPQQVDIKPLSANVALESTIKNPTTPEAQKQAEAERNISLMTIDVAAANDIQEGSKVNYFEATFGVKDASQVTDPVMKPIAEGISTIITMLEKNLKVVNSDGSPQTVDQINQAIETTILANQSWKSSYEALKQVDPAKAKEIIDAIRETGVISAARRLYTERMIIGQESGNYLAAQTKYNEIERQLNLRITERTTVETSINGQPKSKSQIAAEKQTATRDLETLTEHKNSLFSRRKALEERIDQITSSYQFEKKGKTGGVGIDKKERDKDPRYTKALSDLDAVNDEINGTGSYTESIDSKINKAQQTIRDSEQVDQLFKRQAELTTEIDSLNEKLATASGDLATARTSLANKVNETIKSLNGILPEAAKEGLNKFKQAKEQANREIQIEEAKKKAEEAKKEGDMVKRAQAEIKLSTETRYLEEKSVKGLRKLIRRGKVEYDVKKGELESEFTAIIKDPDGWVRNKLSSTFSGVPQLSDFKGLSPDTIDYFNQHPEAVQKLADTIRQETVVSISRQAFMNLDLDPKSMKKLCTIPDVANALQQAVDSDKATASAVEKAIGQKLTKGGLRTFLEKASPWAISIILLIILGIFGTKLLTGGA